MLDLIKPPEEDDEPSKAKGKPPAKGAAPVEEELGNNELKIKVDVSNPEEEKRKIGLNI